jgi:hypothetical protein
MFNFKVGDRFIHYTQRGEMTIGKVQQVLQIMEYEPRLKCKFVNVVLVDEKSKQIPLDGTKGVVYKIDVCDDVE